ncbi:hypothetical protein HMPREF1207_03899 [Paenibacillus sp. HGH0039]|nr:hypothetical protein HMPREF1207_03899 [Paenibacillus sp. HGH0039]
MPFMEQSALPLVIKVSVAFDRMQLSSPPELQTDAGLCSCTQQGESAAVQLITVARVRDTRPGTRIRTGSFLPAVPFRL